MKISKEEQITPKRLLHYAVSIQRPYGDKFDKFNELVHQKFDKLIKIDVKQDIQKASLPLAIMTAILFKKIQKLQQMDGSAQQFEEEIKYKSKEILANSPFKLTESTAQKFFNLMAVALNEPSRLSRINEDKIYLYIYELINIAADHKQSKFIEIQNYKDDEMGRISKVFKQSVYLINYDNSKQALDNMEINHNSVYLLKAKKMLFILIKDKQIQLVQRGTISHQELASIFSIETKLQITPIKQIKNDKTQKNDNAQKSDQNIGQRTQQSTIKSTPTIELITNIQTESDVNSKKNNPQPSPKKMPLSMTMSRIKSSSLFPDDVKCCKCCKQISEFNALFWGYSYFCFECVINPKQDVSTIPTGIIKKFLKNQKYENKQYLIICPQCKSETKIKDYRPWDKPKQYKCGVCSKLICVEHQKFIRQCFCFCFQCRRPTISVGQIFVKYCISCKSRLCQICQQLSKNQCSKCICKKCGQSAAIVDHECKERCHSCLGRNLNLLDCPCDKKLCTICFFTSLQISSKICLKNN